MTARIFEWVYQHLLLVFPPGFRAEYQEEMQAVFAELLAAHSRNVWSLLAVGLRELFQAPLALFRTYRLYWRKHLPDQLNPLEGISPESGPGASGMLPDGRSDWLQALLEISLFAALGAGLVFIPDFEGSFRLPEDCAFVMDSYIHRDARGTGLFRYLLRGVTEDLRRKGYRRVFCHIRIDNKRSMSAYEKSGFSRSGRVRYRRVWLWRRFRGPEILRPPGTQQG